MTLRVYVVLLAYSLIACRPEIQKLPATEVLVRIEASSEVRASTKRLRLRTSVQQKQAGEWVDRPSVTIDLDQTGGKPQWPVDVPVIPTDPRNLPALFQIVAEALDDRGELVVQDRALSSFVRESQLVLTMQLARCGGQPLGTLCENDPQCHGNGCQRCSGAMCAKTAVTKPNALRVLEEADKSTPPADDSDASVPMIDAGTPHSNAGAAGGEAGRGGAGSGGKSGNRSVAGAAGTRNNAAAGSGGAAGGGGMAGQAGDQAPPPTGPKPLTWSSAMLLESDKADALVAGISENTRGDTVVAWWQNASDGYIWMRRYLNGAWDSSPFRVAGDSKPEEPLPVGLGIDNSGAAQLFYRGKTKTYWVRWSGEAPAMLESSPSPVPDPQVADEGVAYPLGLAVDEKGRSTAIWSGAPVDGPATSPVFVSHFDLNHWGMPAALGGITVPAQHAELPGPAYTNSYGLFLAPTVVVELPLVLPFVVGEIKTFVGDTSGAVGPATLKPSQPIFHAQFEIDELSNVTALLITGTAVDNTHAYWSRLMVSTNSWSPLELLRPEPISFGTLTHVPIGDTIAFWLARSADKEVQHGHLATSRYLAAGGWSEPETLSGDFSLEGDSIEAAANAAGKVVATWVQTPMTGSGTQGNSIMYVQYIPSRGWSKPMPVAVVDKDITLEGLTVAEDGRVLLVYSSADPGSNIHDLYAISAQ